MTVSEDVFEKACADAAEQGTSVSALVIGFLRSLSDDHSDFNRLARMQEGIIGEIENFSATSRLARDEMHARGAH